MSEIGSQIREKTIRAAQEFNCSRYLRRAKALVEADMEKIYEIDSEIRTTQCWPIASRCDIGASIAVLQRIRNALFCALNPNYAPDDDMIIDSVAEVIISYYIDRVIAEEFAEIGGGPTRLL